MPIIYFYFELKHIFILLNLITYKGTGISKNIYILLLSTILNFIICFVLSKTLQKNSKLENKEIQKNRETVGFKLNKKEEISNHQFKICLKLEIFIIYFIFHIGIFYMIDYMKYRVYDVFRSLNFISTALCYFLILKEKIYIHHFFSVTAIIIFMFFDSDLLLASTKNIVCSIIFHSLCGLCKTYVKYLMQNKFLSPYLAASASCFFLFLRYLLIILFLEGQDDFFKFKKNYLHVFYSLISNTLDTIFEHLTLYYYSPIHQLTVENLSILIFQKNMKISDLIILVLKLLFTFIYNEIIILNFCGLGDYTKQNIRKRGEQISNYMMKTFESQKSFSDSESRISDKTRQTN